MSKLHDLIRAVMTEAGGRLQRQQVISRVYQKYPNKPWKEKTIGQHLYAASVNRPAAYINHPRAPKYLFDLGETTYELYDLQKHGKWNNGYPEGKGPPEPVGDQQALVQASITLEKDLRDYIVQNLGQLEPGLTLYSQGGISGREFKTDVGKIDILATDKSNNFVAIELKVGTAGDAAVGQLLGYMKSIQRNIAGENRVRGILIADDFEERLRCAVSGEAILLKEYEVHFTFKDV